MNLEWSGNESVNPGWLRRFVWRVVHILLPVLDQKG
jgi:hypothetical protein